MRGYRYGDMTILTSKNEYVIAASGWLNTEGVPFISHSSLDIRGRKITGDIIAFLRFLDSPVDDLAFATFLLSGIFHRLISAANIPLTKELLHSFVLNTRREQLGVSLYTAFRSRFQDIWKHYFEELFNAVGYLPIYDLISEIYKRFRLFELAPEEESTLVKFLDIIKNFEENGLNNLKDFLVFADEEDDEADWNISVPHGENAVSIMTIHKAKGLDNRVVIVLLIDSKQRPDNLFIQEAEEGVQLVRITQKNAEYDNELQELYNQRCFEHAVDDLNKLYVACTRAKEELYVVSVKSEKIQEPSKFLPPTGFEHSIRQEVEPREIPIERTASKHFSSRSAPSRSISSEKFALIERRRGEIIHDILSRVKFVDKNIDEHISSAIKEISGSVEEMADVAPFKSLVLNFLLLPEITPFFAQVEGRTILNEQEFVTPEGRLFRMDRVVIDTESVTVIDFKTGDEKDAYDDQVHGYMNVLRNFYPDSTIHGLLAFVDRKKLRVIA
jgi:ATP-dependent helicase/nuclease subunit A